ncbi:hypothetical protein KGF54_000723 [Candida jiufengensis]|uniref:uncharacterized protein n=1 Tax=Candida jiufengensis TaxID=497108 RepID=UPI002224411C|nr:uncharacterized protein KGF54_000723 [Candida jiufengensis]KAI5956248.1 hypothetical protein KGF54_000723 [Candida jiufengensis]
MDHPNNDIFQNLDMPLLEVFQRGQINNYLDSLSIEDRTDTIEAIHRVMRNHNQQQQQSQQQPSQANRTTHINNYLRIRWFKFLPIFLLNYSVIWSNLTLENIKHFIKLSITKLFFLLAQSLRMVFFLIMIQSYFHGLINMIFAFCDVLTFSDNFLKDLVTFLVDNNQYILKCHENLVAHGNDLFYFFDLKEYETNSVLENFQFLVLNYLSSFLMTDCVNSKGNVVCKPIKNTLIFKLYDAVYQSFPNSSKLSLKYLTMMIYLSYALIGNVICINILMFFVYNFMNKLFGYTQFIKNMKDVVKSTFIQYLA